MAVGDEQLNKIMSHYTVDIHTLEDENRLLKETINNFKTELAKFRKAPLLIADVKEVVGENAILRLHNGNEFWVDVSSEC
ncbi:hypothetical protein KY339_03210, partial [Candidatus Woesearchaeota archaeon]|nr:hypothetical protein [Candidatus Woesearchaeota archaeon]